jgi:hypothetical protein
MEIKLFKKKLVNLGCKFSMDDSALKGTILSQQARKDTKHGINDLPCCLLLLVL